MQSLPVLPDTVSMRYGILIPFAFAALMASVPVIGTLSCISSVGVIRRIIVVSSPDANDAIVSGVTLVSHVWLDGRSRVILPVSPIPTFFTVIW